MGVVILPTLTQYIIFTVIVSILVFVMGAMLYKNGGSFRSEIVIIVSMIYATILFFTSTGVILVTPSLNETTNTTMGTVSVPASYALTLNTLYIALMGISTVILIVKLFQKIR